MIMKQNPVFRFFCSINTKLHRVASEVPGLWKFALRDEYMPGVRVGSGRMVTSTLLCVTFGAKSRAIIQNTL